jgi:thioredoxin 2
VEKLAAEMQGRAIVLKVDTEAHPALAARYRIQSIPNFLVFRQGLLVHQQAGAAPRAQMRAWLEA